MGSLSRRRFAGPVLVMVVAAGGCLFALAETPKDAKSADPSAAATTASADVKADDAKSEPTKTDDAKGEAKPATAAVPAASPAGSSPTTSSPTTSPATAPATQPSPPVHLVKKGKLSFTVSGEGVFVADEPFEVRLKMTRHAGELKISAVAPNRATVSKGDTLLEFDAFAINNEVAAAENELTAAKANLVKAEADADLGEKGDALAMRIQEQETKNAEAGLRWWEQVDGPHMLAQSELGVKLAKANAEDQQDELEQLRKMYRADELTTETADIVVKRALRQLDVAKLSSKISEERAEKVEAHTYAISKQAQIDALEMSRQKLEMLKVTQAQAAVLRKTALATARLASTQSEKKLADLKKDQELFAIKAPADGVVLYGYSSGGAWTGGDPKTMRVGEKLAAGATVMTLFKPGDLKVELGVPEAQAAWVRPGAKADVKPVAYPELNYEGKAGEPTAKSGQAGLGFTTTIELAEVDPKVVPGMKASVRIGGADVDGVLLVPTSAVANGKAWVRKDGQEVEREVVTGRTDGKMVEIVKGLNEGEEVLREAKK